MLNVRDFLFYQGFVLISHLRLGNPLPTFPSILFPLSFYHLSFFTSYPLPQTFSSTLLFLSISPLPLYPQPASPTSTLILECVLWVLSSRHHVYPPLSSCCPSFSLFIHPFIVSPPTPHTPPPSLYHAHHLLPCDPITCSLCVCGLADRP